MMLTGRIEGYHYGHPVFLEVEDDEPVGWWRYKDDETDCPGPSNRFASRRQCMNCGLLPDASLVAGDGSAPDPCLGGFLSGVAFACCGHGVENVAYVKELDGTITDFVTTEQMQRFCEQNFGATINVGSPDTV